jgi:hypothetical protein
MASCSTLSSPPEPSADPSIEPSSRVAPVPFVPTLQAANGRPVTPLISPKIAQALYFRIDAHRSCLGRSLHSLR